MHGVERLSRSAGSSSPRAAVDDVADRLEHLIDRCAEELLLAGEVVVHRGHDDVGLLGDVADRGVDESLAGELPDRRVDDVVATRRPVRGQRRRDVAARARAPSWPIRPSMTLGPWPAGSSIVSRIDAPATPRRPAHRPSRRHVVIDGAMGLFATMPVDEVTVQDIATRGRDDACRGVLPLRLEGADPDRGDAAVRAISCSRRSAARCPQPGDTGGLDATDHPRAGLDGSAAGRTRRCTSSTRSGST